MNAVTEEKTLTRILVVEDHANFRKLLCMSIDMQEGMESCGSASNGRQALELISSTRPDLVLVDLSMPGMGGLEILDKIREEWPEIKCMILSGHSEENYIQEAQKRGASGYILKSKPKEILEAIAEGLKKNEFVQSKNLRSF